MFCAYCWKMPKSAMHDAVRKKMKYGAEEGLCCRKTGKCTSLRSWRTAVNPKVRNSLRMLEQSACLLQFATASCFSRQSSCIPGADRCCSLVSCPRTSTLCVSFALHDACQPNFCSQHHLHLPTPIVFLVQSVHRGTEGSRSCPSRAVQCAQ